MQFDQVPQPRGNLSGWSSAALHQSTFLYPPHDANQSLMQGAVTGRSEEYLLSAPSMTWGHGKRHSGLPHTDTAHFDVQSSVCHNIQNFSGNTLFAQSVAAAVLRFVSTFELRMRAQQRSVPRLACQNFAGAAGVNLAVPEHAIHKVRRYRASVWKNLPDAGRHSVTRHRHDQHYSVQNQSMQSNLTTAQPVTEHQLPVESRLRRPGGRGADGLSASLCGNHFLCRSQLSKFLHESLVLWHPVLTVHQPIREKTFATLCQSGSPGGIKIALFGSCEVGYKQTNVLLWYESQARQEDVFISSCCFYMKKIRLLGGAEIIFKIFKKIPKVIQKVADSLNKGNCNCSDLVLKVSLSQ